MRSESKDHRILYITSRFPALSLTFVANEMKAVTDIGCKVEIISLWRERPDHSGHPVEQPFLDRVLYADIKTAGNIIRIIKALVRKPSIVFTFFQMLPGHLKNPWLLGKLCMSMPKGLIAGIYALDSDCTHIHAHFLTMPTTVALIASKVSGIPFTATAHAFDITSTHPQWVNGSVSYKCRNAAAIVTISQFNKRDILSRWPELSTIRIDVVYNGIDTQTFTPRSADKDCRNKNDLLHIISISNLNEKKGFAYLIEAVVSLRNKEQNVKLDIYGDGPERDNLQNQIDASGHSDRISLRGAIGQEQVAQLCKEADIFVLASIPLSTGDADGLPTVLIESLGSELPSISTQVTGIPEIVIDGDTGRCVPPADSDALAQAISWMANNPKDAQETAINGRQLVLEKFDQKNTSKQLANLWTSCRKLKNN